MRKLLVVMGVPIDDLDMPAALSRIEEFIRNGRATGTTHQIATVNADFVIKAQDDPELRMILQEADMATADGMPLVWGARLLGVNLPGRVTGADLVPALAEISAQKGYSLYLLGGSPGVADRAADALRARHPDIRIVGAVSPPYASVLDLGPALVEDIKNARPDVLLVAFGNPKQEKWIAMHAPELKVPVMIGVGGTLDFIAGVTRRAPEWMQRAGLEWVYRLAQEPRRLWRRYMVDLVGFGYFFTRQWWMMRRGERAPAPMVGGTRASSEPVLIDEVAVCSAGETLTIANREPFVASVNDALAITSRVVIDLTRTRFVDSSGYGALVTLARRARADGGDLRLAAAQPHVAQTLRILRMEHFFSAYPDTASALAAAADSGTGPLPAELPPATPAGWQTVRAPRRLDALSAPEFQSRCAAALTTCPRLIVDLSETVFLASAGLAALIALNREARNQDGELRLACLMPDALQVVRLARLDGVFAVYRDVREAGG